MTKQEFREFCHDEFITRGFRKRKSMYYLKGKGVLCGINLQKSMSDAYYVNYFFFLGEYENIKNYPTYYENDISMRFAVLAEDPYEGGDYMDACIEYELYTKEEIKKYFDEEFEKHIMPVIEGGAEMLIQDFEYFADEMFEDEIDEVFHKVKTYVDTCSNMNGFIIRIKERSGESNENA